jgi:adenosylmethionine-8-amino-7-oxononanoate aminotransferase
MIEFDTPASLWGEFAQNDMTREDGLPAASRLVSALIDLSFAERAPQLCALATRLKGPVLYVGSRHDATARAFESAGLSVTILDPFGAGGFAAQPLQQLDAAGPFALVVLPLLVFGAWGDRPAAGRLIAELESRLAANGALVVDEALPFAGAAVEIVDAAFPIDGAAAGRLGIRTQTLGSQPAWHEINGSWTDAGGTSRVAALRIDAAVGTVFEHALIAAGLILVERGTAGAATPRSRLATYKRRVGLPLCHPFSPLSLSSTPDKVLTLTEGHGTRVRDTHGKSYIDACSGLWNTHVGLGNKEIIDAISAQLHRLSYGTLFGERGNEPANELTEVLLSVAPYPLQWVCYTGSGSESTELGIRLAVLYALVCGRKDAKKIAHLDQSYHGTFGNSASVSGLMPAKELYQAHSIAVPIPTPHPGKCPAGESYVDFALRCADVLEDKAKAGDIAAFIIEPVLGSAGVIVPPVEYFDRIRDICDRNGILLIADEVATGFGRTGRWFACEHFGLRPDILLMAKGINSGYLPMGAVMFSAAIGEKFLKHGVPLLHGSTYNGHPVCCASAIANIALLKRDRLVERSAELGRYLRQSLEDLREFDVVSDLRGLGLMQAVALKQADGAPAVVTQVMEIVKRIQHGGALVYPMPDGIGLCPALTTSTEDIDIVVATLRSALGSVRLVDGGARWDCPVVATVLPESEVMMETCA